MTDLDLFVNISNMLYCSGRQYRTANFRSTCAARNPYCLDVLLLTTEMHIQFVQVLQQGAERRTFGHLGEGVNVLGKAFATVAKLAVGTGNVGVCVVDVA